MVSEESRQAYDRREAEFAKEFGAKACRWSRYNVTRMLNRTGEPPERVAEMRRILFNLGRMEYLGPLDFDDREGPWTGGVFDHGMIWSREGVPWAVVGHPYEVGPGHRELLAILAEYPTLEVYVDDRPSYYGHGTHHVRIERAHPKSPDLRKIVVFHAEDLPDPDGRCGFSIYRNILVQWDEDGDERILNFIDKLPGWVCDRLLIAREHEGTLALRWKFGCAPLGYRQFDDVDLIYDSWEVSSSLAVATAPNWPNPLAR